MRYYIPNSWGWDRFLKLKRFNLLLLVKSRKFRVLLVLLSVRKFQPIPTWLAYHERFLMFDFWSYHQVPWVWSDLLKLACHRCKKRTKVYLFYRCCGPCTKYHRTDVVIPLSESNMTEIQKTDIVFPIPAESKLIDELHGFQYIPLFDVPSAFYITLRASDEELTRGMIEGCLSNWPLLIICILLALIAGFVGWILETWSNREEFPRCFPLGLWEGFWWSFVSMTTVGWEEYLAWFSMDFFIE